MLVDWDYPAAKRALFEMRTGLAAEVLPEFFSEIERCLEVAKEGVSQTNSKRLASLLDVLDEILSEDSKEFGFEMHRWREKLLPRVNQLKAQFGLDPRLSIRICREVLFTLRPMIQSGEYKKALARAKTLTTGASSAIRFEIESDLTRRRQEIEELVEAKRFDEVPSRLSAYSELAAACSDFTAIDEVNEWLQRVESIIKHSEQVQAFKSIDGPHPQQKDSVHQRSSIDKDDLKLICHWSNRKNLAGREDLNQGLVVSALGDYQFGRLASARHAEKSARAYLTALYGECQDVSLHQIRDQRGDWETHDLATSNQLFDVKNARRNFSNGDRFSELCVPEFKSVRGVSSDEVVVLGVLSDYISADKLKNGDFGEALILGQVCKKEIDLHQSVANEIFGSVIEFDFGSSSLESAFSLPGWLFSHPPQFYDGELDRLERAYSKFAPTAQKENMPFSVAPIALRIACLQAGYQNSRAIPARSLAASILDFVSLTGRTLPAIVCLVMGVVLSRLKNNPDAAIKQLRRWLFLSGSPHPLGVYDPLNYVSSFLDTFEQMLWHSRDELFRFNMFRLKGPRILQGRLEDRSWQTILAYCGGRLQLRSGPRISCGTDPLFLGQSSVCGECRRLVCPNCGFCAPNCSKCEPRQKGITDDSCQ